MSRFHLPVHVLALAAGLSFSGLVPALVEAQGTPVPTPAPVAAPDAGVIPAQEPAPSEITAPPVAADVAAPDAGTPDAVPPAEPAVPPTAPVAPAPAAPAVSDAPAAAPQPEAAPAEVATPGVMGTVTGVVTSAEDLQPIAGVRVYVRGEPGDTETDSNGRYTLQVEAGTRSVSFVAGGYGTLTNSVKVPARGSVEVPAALSASSLVLDEYLVTGLRIEGGVAAVLEERRESTAVAEVIGAEQMSRTGDSNAAAALRRVTGLTVVGGKYVYIRGMGDRYSSILMNGLRLPSPEPEVRVVPLDLIPAGLLESVLVQKTYSADLPADFGGGVISMRTKTYPQELTITATMGIGGNTRTTFRDGPSYESGKLDWLGIDDGDRALSREVQDAGKISPRSARSPDGYTAEEISQLGKSLDNRWERGRRTFGPDGNLSLVIGDSFKLAPQLRWGFATAGLYSHQWRAVQQERGRYNVQGSPQRTSKGTQAERQVFLGGMLSTGLAYLKDQRLDLTSMILRQTTDETLYLSQGEATEFNGPFQQTRLRFVERQLFTQQVVGEQVFKKANGLRIDWKYAYSLATRYEPMHLEYMYVRDVVGMPYRIRQSGGDLRLDSDLKDNVHDGRVDLTQPIPVWRRLEAKLKLGGAMLSQQRAVKTRRFTLDAGDVPQDQLIQPPQQILSPDNIGVPGGTKFNEGTLPNDPYRGKVESFAGYGIAEIPITSNLDLMGGLRVEKYSMLVKSEKIRGDIDSLDYLPSSTLTWRLSEQWQLRGGFAQTLNRPDLRELSPSPFIDVESGITKRGDPTLRSARLRHYDARVEWYLSTDESISLGAFYKTFENPIEQQLLGGSAPTQTWKNAKGGYNTGLELEGRKRLDFLSEKLEAFFIASNFAWIKSEVRLKEGGAETNKKRALAGQSPWVFNLQLGYEGESNGLNATLLYNVAGNRIDSVGVDGLDDVIEHSVHQLDAVVSKQLGHGFRLSARARNILNQKRRLTQSGHDFLVLKPGADIMVNLTWAL